MKARKQKWLKLIIIVGTAGILLGTLISYVGIKVVFARNFEKISSEISQRYDELNNKLSDAYKADNLYADFGARLLNRSQPFIGMKEAGAIYCSTKLNGSESDQITAVLLLRKMLFSNGRSPTYPYPDPNSSKDKHGNIVPVVYNSRMEKYLNPFLELQTEKLLLSKVISGTREVIDEYKQKLARKEKLIDGQMK